MVLFYNLFQIVVTLLFGLIGYAAGGPDGMTVSSAIGLILSLLLLLLPMIAVTVRRLHDTNHSGWWCFIIFVPLIGPLWLLLLMLTDSDEENRYGLPVY